MDQMEKMATQKEVVIFSKSSCCMCHTIKKLFHELGANPLILELDNDSRGREIESALMKLGCSPAVPAVFIGGKFVGSSNTIMTLLLHGSLKKMLEPK